MEIVIGAVGFVLFMFVGYFYVKSRPGLQHQKHARLQIIAPAVVLTAIVGGVFGFQGALIPVLIVLWSIGIGMLVALE